MKRVGAFDLCWPRTASCLAAEERYNASVLRGVPDHSALVQLVEEHVRRYPYGIDVDHPRSGIARRPPRVNGYKHMPR